MLTRLRSRLLTKLLHVTDYLTRATERKRYRDAQVLAQWRRFKETTANPVLKCGAKYYSQFDEDGIIREIVRRLGITNGRFIEMGVGDGSENNTLGLLMTGWKGLWVGCEDLIFTPRRRHLDYLKTWISLENIHSVCSHAKAVLTGDGRVDLLSIDLDGNDWYILREVLKHIVPTVIGVEYNAKFPPPIDFVIDYDPNHRWAGDDYFGASLTAWDRLLSPQYRLVCCNYTGCNAFFVHRDCAAAFGDVPENLCELFAPANYFWFVLQTGQRVSPKTLEMFS